MIANILPADTPTTTRDLGQNFKSFFSESSHVAYQMKGNGALNTMKANILSFHTTTISKDQIFFFSKRGHVAYQMKGMTHTATW